MGNEERTPTVWIVNEGGHVTYSKAKRFGTLVPLTRRNINPFRPDRLALELATKLKTGQEDDYLLLSGPPIANALALYLWLSTFDTANLLIWSTEGDYELRTVSSDLRKLMQEVAVELCPKCGADLS